MEITNCVTHETTNAAVMGLGSNEQEMLNFAIKNGIIDLPHLQDQVEDEECGNFTKSSI
ncbi:MAG: hypothetical protein V8Q93_10565 [Blautia faecis]